MKVVFLISEIDYSGGPKMLAWVANQFAIRGENVYFISAFPSENIEILSKKIKYYSLNIRRSQRRFVRNTKEMLKVLCETKKVIDKINPDLVVGFLYSIDYYYTLYNYFFGHYKILLSQRLDPYSQKGISSVIKNWIVEHADGIVFQTVGARDFYHKNAKRKGIVIPNPVVGRTWKYAPGVKKFIDRENIIVVPARLEINQKRQDVMLKAFTFVVKKHPEMRLVFLGNGHDEIKIKSKISAFRLEDYAEVHRAVPIAEEFTKKCKIVCLTSDFEGSPNTLIEAMAMGVNVCATDCSPGGAKALIKDGKTGFLVNRGDYKELAKKICRLIENPEMSDRIASCAKKEMLKYSEEKIAARWISYAYYVTER